MKDHWPAGAVNARGLRCPEPLMKLYAALNDIQAGERLQFEADDPASKRDIQRMCGFLHHHIEYISEEDAGDGFVLIIRKRQEKA